MINIRTKMIFKTESGNVLDKLRARSIELRKDQQKKGNNNGGPKLLIGGPKGFPKL